MFALAKTAAAPGLTAVDVPRPKLRSTDVRIKVTHAGICGTDMHIYNWDTWAQHRIKVPTVTGHEFVGRITELGSEVHGFEEGQRVSAECHVVCGLCRSCRTGQGHLCEQTSIIGVDRDGAFAEEVVVPASNLWPLKLDSIADRHAAIYDPLGNAMHTVMAFNIASKDVLITGAGAIGLMATAMAKANGAYRVIVVEPNPMKRKLALKMGADLAIDPVEGDLQEQITALTVDYQPDVLLEMSGHPKALIDGMRVLANGGKVALLGIPSAEVQLDLAELVIFKGLTLQGIIGRKMFETWYQVEAFVRTHPQMVDAIITHTMPAADFDQAFTLLRDGKAGKIVLEF